MNPLAYLAGFLVPWTAKVFLYHGAFRWRHIHATIQTKLLVAGAPLIVRGVLPFPFPQILMFLFSIGVALYICSKYTDGKLYPDLVAVVACVEVAAMVLVDWLIMPILF